MGKLGGYRPGAGRKKGFKALEAEKARAYVVEKVVKELDPILTAQIEAAKGMYYEKDGLKIFKEKPDGNIGKYLLDQTIGKPTETVELKGAKKLLIDF